MKRILTAIVALVVVGGILLIGFPPLVWGFILLVYMQGLREFYDMIRKEHQPLAPVGYLGFLLSVGCLYLYTHAGFFKNPVLWLLTLPFILILMATYAWFVQTFSVQKWIPNLVWTLVGWLYLTPAACATGLIWNLGAHRSLTVHPLWMWTVPIWMADSFAYYGGRAFGRHLLAPKLSPKKTWEGLFSGILGAGVASFLIFQIWQSKGVLNYKGYDILICTLIAGVIGPTGDLVESAFKRWAGVKDSSNILPGHGGVLDRLDSLLFTAPFFLIYWVHRFQ